MISVKYDFLWIIMQPSYLLLYHARHTLCIFIYEFYSRELFFSNNISLLNTTAYFTCTNISRVSRNVFISQKRTFFSFSLVFLSMYIFFRFSRSFFSTFFSLGRRIGKDDASTSTSTSSSAALRCLNINPSVEVAGFQLGRRDAHEIDIRDKKLPLVASREVQRSYTSVRLCVS